MTTLCKWTLSSCLGAQRRSVLKISTALALSLSGGSLAEAGNGPRVQTNNGPVQGFVKDGVAEFLGIPYAAAPVGNLRWRPPQPHTSWRQVLNTTNYGPICPADRDNSILRTRQRDEDCLFLNIFTPGTKPSRAESCLSSFTFMAAAISKARARAMMEAKWLCKARTVVVTLNYRLGLLGDMANPAIDAEGHPFGNYDYLGPTIRAAMGQAEHCKLWR